MGTIGEPIMRKLYGIRYGESPLICNVELSIYLLSLLSIMSCDFVIEITVSYIIFDFNYYFYSVYAI